MLSSLLLYVPELFGLFLQSCRLLSFSTLTIRVIFKKYCLIYSHIRVNYWHNLH